VLGSHRWPCTITLVLASAPVALHLDRHIETRVDAGTCGNRTCPRRTTKRTLRAHGALSTCRHNSWTMDLALPWLSYTGLLHAKIAVSLQPGPFDELNQSPGTLTFGHEPSGRPSATLVNFPLYSFLSNTGGGSNHRKHARPLQATCLCARDYQATEKTKRSGQEPATRHIKVFRHVCCFTRLCCRGWVPECPGCGSYLGVQVGSDTLQITGHAHCLTIYTHAPLCLKGRVRLAC
jgi:hypothetical protein